MLENITFSTPRYYFWKFNDAHFQNFELHGFSDASKHAYTAVIYLSNGKCNALVSSKVAPIQKASISRLGPLSCVFLEQSVTIVLESLGSSATIQNVFYWSGSLDVLYCIKGVHKKWKQFIQNKVEKIRNLTNIKS